jgi:predicted Zn-dependent protease
MVSAIALAIISNNPTAFIAGPAALQQQQLGYSRIFEREADRYGFNNLIAAGMILQAWAKCLKIWLKLENCLEIILPNSY